MALTPAYFETDRVTGQEQRLTGSGGPLVDNAAWLANHADEHAAMGNIAAILDVSTSSSVVTLLPGEHQSTSLVAGNYWVDAEFDVLVKSSSASACFGAELTSDTDAYSTTAGSLATQTGLDVGAADFSLEFWLQLTADTPNDARPFGWGATAGGCMVHPYFSLTGGGVVQVGLELHNAAGTSFKNATQITASGVLPGTDLKHYVVTIDRAAGAGTGTVTYFINGVQIGTQTYTEDATPANLSASGCTAGTSRIIVGGTLGGNAEWDGRIEDIKVYTRLLTVSEIEARNAAGPVRGLGIDAADAYCSWWLSFQNSADWSNPLHPECISGYGSAIFNSLIGSPAISERIGGAAASSQNSARVRASVPQAIHHTGTYLALYGDSASGGTVRITPLG